MCGRVVQATGPLQVAILCGLDVPDTRFAPPEQAALDPYWVRIGSPIARNGRGA